MIYANIESILVPDDLGRSKNLKQVPQNFMKAFNVDDVTLTSQLMT